MSACPVTGDADKDKDKDYVAGLCYLPLTANTSVIRAPGEACPGGGSHEHRVPLEEVDVPGVETRAGDRAGVHCHPEGLAVSREAGRGQGHTPACVCGWTR